MTIALSDLPERGLSRGDVGTVVEVYGDEAFEVEFVDESGHTIAVLTLEATEVRKPMSEELKRWPAGDGDSRRRRGA